MLEKPKKEQKNRQRKIESIGGIIKERNLIFLRGTGEKNEI